MTTPRTAWGQLYALNRQIEGALIEREEAVGSPAGAR